MPGNALDNKIAEFNSEHEATLTRAILDTPPRKMKGLDLHFFYKQKKKGQRAILYHRTVATALVQTVKNGLKINETGDYSLPELNIPKFLQDFEAIMALRKEETEYDRNRKPFEGISQEKLLKHLVDLTKRFDRKLSYIWADSILEGDMTVEEMKRITDRMYTDFRNAKDPKNLDFDQRKKLGCCITALYAMQALREKRGFWFSIRHPFLNSAEKAYLLQLERRYTELVLNDFPVLEAKNEFDKSLMTNVYKTVDLVRNRKNMDEMEKQQRQNEEKRREISNVHEKLQPITSSTVEQEKIIDEIVKELPRCRWEKSLQKSMLTGVYFKLFLQDAQDANEHFDYNVAKGRSGEAQMAENVKAVFRRVYSNIGSFGYMSTDAGLVAAQVITDVMMKRLSPAAFDPKKYEEFTSGYVFKHAAAFKDITGMDGTEPVFTEAKKIYEEMQPEPINVNEANMIESVEVGEQVENLPNMEASKVLKN